MNVSFTDFWPDFQPNNNFFIYLLKSINDKVQVVPFGNSTDILIYSCFGNQHQNANRNQIKKIFYTGESLPPNFNECDFSWTFDLDDYKGKNIRFPLWLLQIDFFDKRGYKNPEYVIPLNFITDLNTNPWYIKNKNKFCVIVNNHLPNRRDEIIKCLARKKEVHGFGNIFGNSWFYGESKKIDTISDYRFNICFENKLYPGYYTEKLIHAKTAGCIPLYYGDPKDCFDFNTDSFLNLNDFKTIEEYTEYIFKIEETPSLLNDIKQQPLFKTPQYPILFLEDIKIKLQNIK